MMRGNGWVVLTAVMGVALGACVSEDPTDKATGEPAALDASSMGAADSVSSAYQGELAFDTPVTGQLSRSLPYHFWGFDAAAGDAVYVDVASRAGDDVFALLYTQTPAGAWTLLDWNDDCASGTLNACIERTLPTTGHYLIGVTTYAYATFGRHVRASYTVAVFCHNASGACDVVAQACGSRGLAACGDGDYCDWSDDSCGAADVAGVCQPRPEIHTCTRVADEPEVCGCDGQTYTSACFAAANGVDVAQQGPCPGGQGEGQTCGGIAALQCAEGLVCDYSANTGCDIADMGGVCVIDHVQVCMYIYLPVCGCDGVTYGNDCQRRAGHVALDHPGRCDGQGEGQTCGGIAALQCAEGLVCDYSANDETNSPQACYPDMGGVCVQDTQTLCTRIYQPVCGCDGATYANDCERRGAHVARAKMGPC